jgi:hypothetical protein
MKIKLTTIVKLMIKNNFSAIIEGLLMDSNFNVKKTKE